MTLNISPRGRLKYRDSAVIGADGTATVSISPTSSWPWTVKQVSIELTGSTPVGARATLRDNGSFVSRMIAGGDVADGAPPVPLDPGEELTVTWEGATPGQVAKLFALYDEGKH